MKVKVLYWAQIKKAAKTENEVVEVEDSTTPRQLVKKVAEDHGDPLRGFLLEEDGEPRKHLLLIVGDRHVNWDDEEALKDGEELTIMPPISGGSK